MCPNHKPSRSLCPDLSILPRTLEQHYRHNATTIDNIDTRQPYALVFHLFLVVPYAYISLYSITITGNPEVVVTIHLDIADRQHACI
jgi:hypothetical protein